MASDQLVPRTGPQAARPWQRGVKKIDENTLAAFLFALEETGDVQSAADAVGCSPSGIRRYADPAQSCYDPEFAEAWAEAKARFVASLKSATLKRATVGWEEPIIGGLNRDEIVAYKPVFSDRLAELFLKRYDPKFRDKLTIESTKTVNVIHAMDLSKLSQESRQMVRALLDAQKPVVIDVEAVDVPAAEGDKNADGEGTVDPAVGPGSGADSAGQG